MAGLITRRQFVRFAAAALLSGAATAGYAFAVEPYRLIFPRYRISLPGWPEGLRLTIAMIADLHICRPWMTVERVASIVEQTNALGADMVVLLGDFVATHRFVAEAEDKQAWAAALARLSAPLGVHAVLGNHDWWEDIQVQRRRSGPTPVGEALVEAGIPLYENTARRIEVDGQAFWLAGLGDQWAFFFHRDLERRRRTFGYEGTDDLAATLGKVTDDGPVILMAHEPDVFARMPERVALTLSGHTHGGQVQLMGYAPVVPSRYGRRYVYGHIRESGRQMIVSGGIGCSGMPIRFGRPPEVTLVEIG